MMPRLAAIWECPGNRSCQGSLTATKSRSKTSPKVKHSKRADYDKLASALIRTLKEFLADEFTVELNHAWVTVYGMIAETMTEAAEN
jgi:hemoglobin-like flavoprotein